MAGSGLRADQNTMLVLDRPGLARLLAAARKHLEVQPAVPFVRMQVDVLELLRKRQDDLRRRGIEDVARPEADDVLIQ